MTPQELDAALLDLTRGDRIRMHPHNGGTRWWTVRATDGRFVVATRRAAFPVNGDDVVYTVIDRTGWAEKRYNGAGNGVVRSSLNTLGGGWDIGPDGEGCAEILAGLQAGEWELSHRRVVDVERIEVHP